MNKIPYTIEVIEKLRWNAHLGKFSHFEASKSGRNYHVWVGLPIVVINILLGSLLFALMKDTLPDWSKWVGGVFSLIAAMLGGIQTFFDFKGNYEGHRSMANQYLAIARECERIIALYFDGKLRLDELSDNIQVLNERYQKVNLEAEKYLIKDKDYKEALAKQNAKASKDPSLVQLKKDEIKKPNNKALQKSMLDGNSMADNIAE